MAASADTDMSVDEARLVALICSGASRADAAAALGISVRQAYRWLARPHVAAHVQRHEADVGARPTPLRDEIAAMGSICAAAEHVRAAAEHVRAARERIAAILVEGVEIMIAILRDPEVDANVRVKAFASLADRGGLRPGAELLVRDEYADMPLDELEAEAARLLQDGREETGDARH